VERLEEDHDLTISSLDFKEQKLDLNSRDPRGKWTRKEDELLIKADMLYEGCWARISEFVGKPVDKC
jgi:hypothetical protein